MAVFNRDDFGEATPKADPGQAVRITLADELGQLAEQISRTEKALELTESPEKNASVPINGKVDFLCKIVRELKEKMVRINMSLEGI